MFIKPPYFEKNAIPTALAPTYKKPAIKVGGINSSNSFENGALRAYRAAAKIAKKIPNFADCFICAPFLLIIMKFEKYTTLIGNYWLQMSILRFLLQQILFML